ncbi:MAG: hypothetical protein P0Y50_06045 [Candidatus Brevundimonas colombiensis]|uniref:Uncharacterized protein n=1 Tax=Candidatus Brevundimonas colombiensis TaxID=3121376 RepID=A0AAJ6BKS3_9CAUL|nr:hypothetical protein [Brevundimonas sp.]WEK41165.1 MAG: hypothetical protein P0Y50_06045 [Brevundimonas sp.]
MRDGGLLGWCTEALVKLDDTAPGVLARVLTAAPARRQAIFAALASQEENVELFEIGDDLFPASFAELIRHGRSGDILRRAFGDVPEGLSGMLAQIGERPLSRAKDYIALHDLLADADVRAAEALRGSGRITCRKLDVLNALDPRWRHANTLERIDSGGEALMFNQAISFIQSLNSKATDEAIAGAIAAMRPTSTLARLLDRLLQRADHLPAHPIAEGDNELRPLLTMRNVLEAGRRYRNCLRHRLADVAVGRIALAEYRGECLVEFRPLTAGVGWLLRDVHIARNRPVSLSLFADVEMKCDEIGIPRINEAGGGDGRSSYRHFTKELEWAA